MSRQTDLEELIRKAYAIVPENEGILATAGDPTACCPAAPGLEMLLEPESPGANTDVGVGQKPGQRMGSG